MPLPPCAAGASLDALPDGEAALRDLVRRRRAAPLRRGAAAPPVELVAIGASAGGVDALMRLLSALPPGFAPAIAVVLHIPEDRHSRLVEVFSHRCALPVREAGDKAPVRPGTVHFAGPGYHLSVERERTFSLSCEPPVHYSRPSIDLLFDSVADACGPSGAAILLTGASEDGAAGLCRVGERGGLTAVQSPAEAQVPVMPAAALARCAPDFVLPLAGIGRLLAALSAPAASSAAPLPTDPRTRRST